MLALADVESRLFYCAVTGALFWRHGGAANPAWSGKLAGNLNGEGYVQVSFLGRLYKAHHLAWLLATGEWPQEHIDHINGNRSDNRLANLRLASAAQNACNRSISKNNTSGFPGVSWKSSKRKWVAIIQHRGVKRHLGYFDDPQRAAEAYRRAAEKLFGAFARSGIAQ